MARVGTAKRAAKKKPGAAVGVVKKAAKESRSPSRGVRRGKEGAAPRARAGRKARSSARKNPPQLGELLSHRVRLIEYNHAKSAQKAPYVHRFPRSDGEVALYGMPDGSLRIVGVRPLWKWYTVRDGE